MTLALYPEADGDTSEDDRGIPEGSWVDLHDPTDAEIARVERACGIRVPTRENLREIEASSRLRTDKGSIYMSAPLFAGLDGGHWELSPAGFILAERFLVTVRFDRLKAFEMVRDELGGGEPQSPPHVLLKLMEEVVDHDADQLERCAEELTASSAGIFAEQPKPRRKLGQETRRLRRLMVSTGGTSERMTKVRHTFLTMGRMADFLLDRCAARFDDGLRQRLASIRKDIASLDEFESSMSGRVQLLLDAATGFISMEQNDVVKVLTVVSVAGVPPVLIAGVYGMNFKYLPELAWPWGYPFALALMAATTILPVLWFKWRDWI